MTEMPLIRSINVQKAPPIVINPGEATDWLAGSARVVILDLDDMSYTVEPLG